MGGSLQLIAAFLALVGFGGLLCLRIYRRSAAGLDYVDDGYVLPPTEASAAAEAAVRRQAQPEIVELQSLAQKVESGAQLTPAEHARIAQLVGELGTLEQRS